MNARLIFPDPATATDLLTFAGRAATLGDGNVRLRAGHGTLAASCAPLAAATLLDATPTVLGLRIMPVDAELECDLVVAASALAAAGACEVSLPSVATSAPWAGIAPPRGGWQPDGVLSAETVAARAHWGFAAVAHALPQTPGEEVVRTVRGQIWGEPDEDLAGMPRGVAFAAVGLGFTSGAEQVPLFATGPWRRASFARGHVLVRTRVHTGLTAVRSTGTS